ncbi:MAG: type VI secretion system baseplate subunit TssK [Terriglobales bacterium]
MKQLRPVIWTKGTFLTPQHLQLQDRFIEDSLHFELQALSFRPWGFTEVAIDQQKLSDGHFVISRAGGIFPEGLMFDIPDADAAPESKHIAELFEPNQEMLDVYLALPEYRPRGLNVSLAQRQSGVRYIAELDMFRDENTGTSEKPVQVARKNFRILVEGDSLEGTSKLRIARVQRTSAGMFRLDAAFVPPLLSITASDFLSSMLRGLIEIMHARSTGLAGLRRQKNQSLADFTATDIANFWLLYTINSHFPVFNHLYESKKGHPEELYSAMLSLAGALTTFSPKVQPRDLPAYDHDDLGKCFADLNEKLRSLMETVVPTNVVSLPLKSVQPSIYATALGDDRYLQDTRMYLAMSAEMPEADLIRKAPQLLKVCSANHVEHLIKQALSGMTMTHLSSPPSGIPMKLRYQYFSLTQSGVAWEAVQRARNVAAYVPSDFPNPQLELIILLPQAK